MFVSEMSSSCERLLRFVSFLLFAMSKNSALLKTWLLVVFCHLVGWNVVAQNKNSLEKEKAANQKKIEEANKILEQTQKTKVVSLGQLNAINAQISSSKKLIRTINRELGWLQEDVSEIEIVVQSLEEDIAQLKKEYAAMVYAASKSNAYSRLMFLFASETFYQFIRRLSYLKQYSEVRKEQIELIKKVQAELISQQENLNMKRKEKEQLLASQITESNKLLLLQEKQRALVAELAKKEEELLQEIIQRQESDKKLAATIAELVAKEMKAAREKAATKKTVPDVKLDAISASFAEAQKKLNWPVKSGFIASPFGKQPHPVLKNITIDNLGIDIQTNNGEPIFSVFDGKIQQIAFVPGKGTVVFVQHGDFITVYGNLKDTQVNVGQEIKTRDKIGNVFTDKDGVSILQFQIWRTSDGEPKRLNPEDWLYSRN